MKTMTFRTWTLSQAHSFIIAMANAMVNGGQVSFPVDFDEVMTEVYGTFNNHDYVNEGVDVFTFGNFVVTVNGNARKIGLLNTRSGNFVETYCNKKDAFDIFVGLGVVWAKYNHIKQPKLMKKKMLSELKPNEIFKLVPYSEGMDYEFIGTSTKRSGNKYIAVRIDDNSVIGLYTDVVYVIE